MDGEREDIKTSTIPWDPESTNKAGYPHFMLKEIFEQPRRLTDSMSDKMDLERNSHGSYHDYLDHLSSQEYFKAEQYPVKTDKLGGVVVEVGHTNLQ